MAKKAKAVRKRPPPRETRALARFPFLRYLWFLNAKICVTTCDSIAERLAFRDAVVFSMVAHRPGDPKTDVTLEGLYIFKDPSAYEMEFIVTERGNLPDRLAYKKLEGTHNKVTMLQNFQARLRQALDLMLEGRFSGAGSIISEFTKNMGGIEFWGHDIRRTRTGKRVWVKENRLRIFARTTATDVQIWYDLGRMGMNPEWRDCLGRCPIADCENKYFLKRRADQKFCSPRHRVLYKMRRDRGQDPATGQRKRDIEVLTD